LNRLQINNFEISIMNELKKLPVLLFNLLSGASVFKREFREVERE
jgi:hypothetical protein